MNSYERRFKIFLEKDELAQLPPEEPVMDNSGDIDAMQNTLDDGSQVTDFDVQNVNQLQQDIQSQKATQMISVLKQWIDRISAFKEFLNGTDASSIQTTLSKAVTDTLFDKIKTSENKRIARVASDLGAFNEILKGYIASGDDPKNRFV